MGAQCFWLLAFMKSHRQSIKGSILSLLAASVTALAQSDGQMTSAREALKGLPNAELPAKAVQVVSAAAPKDRAAMAAAVGRAIAAQNPQLTPAVVTAVATKQPKLAGAIAGAAAGVLPESARSIAVAAASSPGVDIKDVRAAVIGSAPAHASEVVLALHDLEVRKATK